MNDIEILNYISMYEETFPNEVPPSIDAIEWLREHAYVMIESEYNLIYLEKYGDGYDTLAHWCIASGVHSFEHNFKAMIEVKRFVKKLNSNVYISNLNEKYLRTTEFVDEEYRKF